MLPEEVLKKTRPERFKNEMRSLRDEWLEKTLRYTLPCVTGFATAQAHVRFWVFALVLCVFHALGYAQQRRLAKMRVRLKEKDMI